MENPIDKKGRKRNVTANWDGGGLHRANEVRKRGKGTTIAKLSTIAINAAMLSQMSGGCADGHCVAWSQQLSGFTATRMVLSASYRQLAQMVRHALS